MPEPCRKPLDWLAAQGCTFVCVHPRSKQPLHAGWPDALVSVNAAEHHIERGGNVGILLGRPSHNLICLDLDLHFPLVCDLYPKLAQVRITRPDAPERGKLLVRVASLESLHNRAWAISDTSTPTVELLVHRRQALVAPSIHPQGSRYRLHLGGNEIPCFAPNFINSVWEVLTADPFAWYAQPSPALTTGQLSPISFESVMSKPSPRIADLRTILYTRFPTALAVFMHFGRVTKVRRIGGSNLRLLGNGGLIVGDPDTVTGWRWYCFRDGIGGDIVDAVGYCVMGSVWNRYSKKKWKFLSYMLEQRNFLPIVS